MSSFSGESSGNQLDLYDVVVLVDDINSSKYVDAAAGAKGAMADPIIRSDWM